MCLTIKIESIRETIAFSENGKQIYFCGSTDLLHRPSVQSRLKLQARFSGFQLNTCSPLKTPNDQIEVPFPAIWAPADHPSRASQSFSHEHTAGYSVTYHVFVTAKENTQIWTRPQLSKFIKLTFIQQRKKCRLGEWKRAAIPDTSKLLSIDALKVFYHDKRQDMFTYWT